MNHFSLIQNEFLIIAANKKKTTPKKSSPKKSQGDKTWNKFFEAMGQIEVPNPDPKRKSDRIKITSLRGAPADSPKGKLLREVYKKWKGSGSSAVKEHVKSLDTKRNLQKRIDEVQSLKKQLKDKEKELKQQQKEKSKSETEKERLRQKLEEKIKSKKDEVEKNKQQSESQQEQPAEEPKKQVAITNKLNEQYTQAINSAKTNASKLHGSVDILGDIPKPSASRDEELNSTANNINNALNKLGINANVVDVTAGPVFSTYHTDFDVKDMKKIQNSADEIEFILGKPINVRINREKHTADIEIQNDNRSPVMMKELVTSNKFVNEASDPKTMPIILGKDKNGEPEIVDLSDSRTPHVLIVGQTGAGKSVLLHQIISSVLYGKDKKDAQLVLLDPKGGAEFGAYDGSDNLAEPVAKTPKSALAAVSKLHKDMEDRYKLFGKVGVKNVNEFNDLVTKDPSELTDEQRKSLDKLSKDERKPIPKKVLVVDELSDLMSNENTRREMINHVNALGRKARASGIHMVLATQFPSKRVIPTEIQSNLPLKAIMKMDSSDGAKYVDTPGAEKLLGKGDMIIKGPGEDKRVQSGFIKDTTAVAKEFGGTGKEKQIEKEKTEEIKQTVTEPSIPEIETKEPEFDQAENFKLNISRLREKLKAQQDKINKALAEADQRQKEIQQRLQETQKMEDEQSNIEEENQNLQSKRQKPDVIQEEPEPEIETNQDVLVSPSGEEVPSSEKIEEPNINVPKNEEFSDDELQKQIDELTKPVPVNDVSKSKLEIQNKKNDLLDRLKKIFKSKK